MGEVDLTHVCGHGEWTDGWYSLSAYVTVRVIILKALAVFSFKLIVAGKFIISGMALISETEKKDISMGFERKCLRHFYSSFKSCF